MSAAIVLVMILSVTGAFLINVPGSSPDGLADGPLDESGMPAIGAADAFLATHDAADRSSLNAAEQAQVNQWKDVLDDYNNGVIGPGHCS